MSSREYAEWMAYYRLEPFGEERGDLRAGVVAATVANVNRDPKVRGEPYSPRDFMPLVEEETEAPEPEEVYLKIRAWAAMAGATETKDEGRGMGEDEGRRTEDEGRRTEEETEDEGRRTDGAAE